MGTREYPGNTFGGRIDDVQDPQTGMIVTLRVFGDYSMQVKDPVALITNLVGTVDVANNEAITGWMSDQLLKVMRTHMTTQIVRNGWPILGLSAYTPDIEEEVMAKGNEQLASYGVAIIRMGNFDINLSEQDEAQLKTLAKDTAYSRLAGSFQQYAAGEMALGAGQGMAQGGAGVGGRLPGRRARPWRPGCRARAQPGPRRPQDRASRAAAPASPPPPRRRRVPQLPCRQPGRAPSSARRAARRWPRPRPCAPTARPRIPPGAKFCASCGTPHGGGHRPLHVVRGGAGGRRPFLPVVRHCGRRARPGGESPPAPPTRSMIAALADLLARAGGGQGFEAAVAVAAAVAAASAAVEEAAASSSSAVVAAAAGRPAASSWP